MNRVAFLGPNRVSVAFSLPLVGRAGVGVERNNVVWCDPHPNPPHVLGVALRRRDGEGIGQLVRIDSLADVDTL